MNCDRDDKVGTDSNLDEIIAIGAAAYARIKSEDQQHADNNLRRYDSWFETAKAVDAVSHKAMTRAGTNDRMNPQYAAAFSRLLDDSGFAGMEPTLRAALLRIIEPEFEAWRATKLTEQQRLRWNNPVYLKRKFDAFTNPKPKRTKDDTIKQQRDEIQQLKKLLRKVEEELQRRPHFSNGIDRQRLAKVLGQLGNDQEGIVINAANEAVKMLKKTNLSWFEVLGVAQ
jgi:hypothetical protein